MKRAEIKALLALAILFFLWTGERSYAQADEDAQEQTFHVFTDKSGKTMEAVILAVSPDKTKLRIRRKDGLDFDFSILTLSLDDQQYIKDWLKGAPARKTAYNLDVKATKHQGDTVRQEPRGYDYIRWATTDTNYSINIRNTSREVLSGASVEYFVILSQGLYVNPYEEGSDGRKQYGVDGWWYSHDGPSMRKKKGRRSSDRPLFLIHGKAEIEELAYNHEIKVETETFPIREIEGDREYAAKDIVLGVIARVTDQSGNEVMVYRSSDDEVVSRDWDSIVRMPKGDPLGHKQIDNSAVPRS